MRIVRVATIPFVVMHHLEGQIRASIAAGHEVFVVTARLEGAEALAGLGAKEVVHVDIPREISPLADLLALARLVGVYRRLRPDLVHSITPKAGLLSAIAAWLCRVPVRLHTFTGQAWATRGGFTRWASRMADRVILRLDTRVYADSFSQRDFLIAEGVARPGEIHVQGKGSLAGVDLARFDPERLRGEAAGTRAGLGIPPGTKVIVFVGRVTRDKGIGELVSAFGRLQGAALVLVGPLEPERDPLEPATLEEIRRNPAIHAVGYQAAPESYIAMADVLCLPSYREGFGTVVLEAAALGVPAVGTRIVGLSDAVVEGETGVLVPAKDPGALGEALSRVLADDALRRRLGAAARERVRRDFDAAQMRAALLTEYASLESRR